MTVRAPPVVLVHGLLASPMMMWPMKRRLTRAGLQVFTVRLGPGVLGDVRALARQLDGEVARIARETGAARVDVVAVSQGGVLALWWAHHLGGFARLERLLLVGAPVRGTWAAALGALAFGAVSRGVWQILPGSSVVRALHRPLPPGVRVHTLGLTTDPVVPPASCVVAGAVNEVLPARLGPLSHQWLVLSRPIADRVVALLAPPPADDPSDAPSTGIGAPEWRGAPSAP